VALKEHAESDALKQAAAGSPPPVMADPEPKDWHGPGGVQLATLREIDAVALPVEATLAWPNAARLDGAPASLHA
jgi:hypothetical protein